MIIFSGPCVIESKITTLSIAQALKDLVTRYPGIRFCFKASYDKANRTSKTSFRGVGREYSLDILREVKSEYGLSIMSDIHSVSEVPIVSDVLDVCQVPAFLCRQTDLLYAVADTGKKINIKKGQFVSPDDVRYIVDKIRDRTNAEIFITERGHCFGYNNLVVDFRSFSILKDTGCKVIFDASHSFQTPSYHGHSGGTTKFSRQMARAAYAYGVDGIFAESHVKPEEAKCDRETTISIIQLERIVQDLTKLSTLTYDD